MVDEPSGKPDAAVSPSSPHADVVDLLERALDAAKLGEINFLVIYATMTDGSRSVVEASGTSDAYQKHISPRI